MNPYVEAVCRPLNFSLAPLGEWPWQSPCNYGATVKLLSNLMGVCICPPGWHLDDTQRNCYGYNTSSVGDCSVNCGSGFREVTRTCNKAPGSTDQCYGNTTILESCSNTMKPCPIDDAVALVTIELKINSKVIDIHKFDTYIEEGLQEKTSHHLTRKCLNEKNFYENICCPGRKYSGEHFLGNQTMFDDCIPPSFVKFFNKYAHKGNFAAYMTVKPNPNSWCCAGADAVTSGKKRKKRTTNEYIDQYELSAAITSNPLYTDFLFVLQTIDRNAAIQFTWLTTTTTTTLGAPIQLVNYIVY